jgi:hypothetical protein
MFAGQLFQNMPRLGIEFMLISSLHNIHQLKQRLVHGCINFEGVKEVFGLGRCI